MNIFPVAVRWFWWCIMIVHDGLLFPIFAPHAYCKPYIHARVKRVCIACAVRNMVNELTWVFRFLNPYACMHACTWSNLCAVHLQDAESALVPASIVNMEINVSFPFSMKHMHSQGCMMRVLMRVFLNPHVCSYTKWLQKMPDWSPGSTRMVVSAYKSR